MAPSAHRGVIMTGSGSGSGAGSRPLQLMASANVGSTHASVTDSSEEWTICPTMSLKTSVIAIGVSPPIHSSRLEGSN